MARGRVSRRGFLRGLAASAAVPYVLTPSALGAGGRRGANDRIVVGSIGTGGRGTGVMRGFLGSAETQVVAVCDVDAGRRERAKRTVEDHYAQRGDKATYRGCAASNEFEAIVARDDIDVVTVGTPDHWHAIPAIAAAEAGKDIYCEKPLSLTIAEGRAMSEAVRRYGVVFQTGSQQRSDARFRLACELARNGCVGRLHTIRTSIGKGPSTGPEPPQPVPEGFDYDRWLGPAPWAPYTAKRCHYSFRWNLDYSGGKMTDWGAHHNDIAQWGNGAEFSGPVEIVGRGQFPDDGLFNTPMTFHVEYTYANGVKLICSDSEIFPNGVRFEGTEGWVFVKRGAIDARPKSILRSPLGPDDIRLYESHNHFGNFLECVRSRRETAAPCEIAHRSATVCHLGNIAMLLGRRLQWDPDRERFVNDPEADRMVARPMREPWRLPTTRRR